jgi:hypothetical protein
MTERASPKAELIATLVTARQVATDTALPAVRLAMIHGLLNHAYVLAQHVGENMRPRKEPRAEPR